MFSIRALKCLVAIVEQGSLTQAAAVLHISPPTLSHPLGAPPRQWARRSPRNARDQD